jgi:uncharacterized Zn finger protein
MVKLMKCEYCGEEFSNVVQLNMHKGQSHAPQEAEKFRYPCKRCGEVFPSPMAFAEHMKNDHPEVVNRINRVYWGIIILVIIITLWQLFT